MNKILVALTSILTIVDIALRNTVWIALTSPQISLNFLEIAIFVFIIILVYRWLPQNMNRLCSKTRAKKFYSNWLLFKKVLSEYQKMNSPDLQKKYVKLRINLLKDFGFFFPIIKEIHKDGNDPYGAALNNLERCFLVENINDWFRKVERRVPEELDCFDRFIASIEGFYNSA